MRLRSLLLAAGLTAAVATPATATAAPRTAPITTRAAAITLPGVLPATTTATTTATAATAKAAPAAAGCAGAQLPAAQQSTKATSTATLCLLNQIRRQHHLTSFHPNPTLAAVATRYAHTMITGEFFDHTTPNGTTFLQRIQHTTYLHTPGLRRWSVGENIAWGNGSLSTPTAIVNSWMHSPGHRANILNAHFTEVGIAAANGAPIKNASTQLPAATYVNDFGQRTH